MSFMQTYYTSCEVGLRGCKGFQFNAATDGIDQSILQQVERLGLYVPPVNSPSRPSPDEIKQFPVSLVYQRLHNEAAVLAQAQYIGPDYSGRFGNYFTHSLISMTPDLDIKRNGFLPIEMWQSEVWATKESSTIVLTSLDKPPTGEFINPQTVDEFLKRDNNIERVPQFIAAVEGTLSTGRRIVIVADNETIALWIAVASYALPLHLAMRLTFNTYIKNPYQTESLIVGTTQDSDFNFASHEIEHQYYVFDFMGENFTPMRDISAFARNVAAVYRELGTAHMAAFGAFIERVAQDLPLDQLNIAFGCYALISKLRLSEADVASIVRWAAERLDRFSPEQIYLVLSSVRRDGACNPQVVDAYTDLFMAAQGKATSQSVRKLIEIPYLEWLFNEVIESSPLEALRQTIERLLIRPSIESESPALRAGWIKKLRQMEDPARLCALLQLGDKLGFLNESDVSLRKLGENVLVPALADPFMQRSVMPLIQTAVMRQLIYGVAAFLVARLDDLEAFNRIAALLDQPSFFAVLESYAVDTRNLEFYFRLLGIRANRQQHVARTEAFQQCLAVVPQFGRRLTAERVEYAFDTIWLGRPLSLDEALQVLSLLQEKVVAGTNISLRLVDLLIFEDAKAIEPKQRALAKRLAADSLYRTLGEKRLFVDAYTIVSSLEHGEHLAGALGEALHFVERASGNLTPEMLDSLTALLGSRLAHVKEVETHCALLLRAYRSGSPLIIDHYGREIGQALAKRVAGQSRAVARLFEVALSLDRHRGGAGLKAIMLQKILPQALRNWKQKELEMVDLERNLANDSYALQLWINWREDFLQHRGPLNRFKQWLSFS